MKEKLKARFKQHAPELIVAGLTIFGVAGWIVAALKEQQLRNLETVDPDAWPTIEITPELMKDIRGGATLMYREFKTGPKSWVTQSTTMADGFPPEADEEYSKRITSKKEGK